MKQGKFDPQYLSQQARLIRAVARFKKKHSEQLGIKSSMGEDDYVPLRSYRSILSPVRELYIAGGGGAGRALPAAVQEAVRYGLDLDKINVVCASSVGCFLALSIAMRMSLDDMMRVMQEMPTDKFTDWNWFDSLTQFFSRWSWCRGDYIQNHIKKLIKIYTGLDDPTFQELYDAGFDKELRIVTTNLDKGDITIFSYINTPDKKIASTMALSCSVPFVFPPRWVENAQGVKELHTDGGVLKNYPFGVGSDERVPLNQQLGFIFVNGSTAKKIQGDNRSLIRTFIDYLVSIVSALAFKNALTLSEPEKRRTVTIQCDHTSLRFTATPEQQAGLNEAGREGVRKFVSQAYRNAEDNYQTALTRVYRATLRKEQSEQSARPAERVPTPSRPEPKGMTLSH